MVLPADPSLPSEMRNHGFGDVIFICWRRRCGGAASGSPTEAPDAKAALLTGFAASMVMARNGSYLPTLSSPSIFDC